eukprot:8295960-Alexandrium_andersonii.AAC.1
MPKSAIRNRPLNAAIRLGPQSATQPTTLQPFNPHGPQRPEVPMGVHSVPCCLPVPNLRPKQR